MRSVAAVGAVVLCAGLARADLVRPWHQETDLWARSIVAGSPPDLSSVRVEGEGEFVPGVFEADSAVFNADGAAFGSGAAGLEVVRSDAEFAEWLLSGGSSSSIAIGGLDRGRVEAEGRSEFSLEFELLERARVSVAGLFTADSEDNGNAFSRLEASLDGVFSESFDSGEDEDRFDFGESETLDPGRYTLRIESQAVSRTFAGDDRPLASFARGEYEISVRFDAVPAPGPAALLCAAGLLAMRRRR